MTYRGRRRKPLLSKLIRDSINDTHELTDAPADQLEITCVPDAPQGTVISRVDVVIRLRRV